MAEGLLSNDHENALQQDRLLREAHALRAWMTLAALRGMSLDETQSIGQTIVGSSNKKLGKFHREISTAIKLEQRLNRALGRASGTDTLLIDAEAATANDIDEVVDGEDSSEVSVPTANDDIDEVATVVSLKGNDSFVEEDKIIRISAKSQKWAASLLGLGYKFEGRTIEEIATAIFEKAGSPISSKKTVKGRDAVDAIGRIVSRLEGRDYTEIAESEGEGVTPASVQQWFSLRVIRNIKEQNTEYNENFRDVAILSPPQVDSETDTEATSERDQWLEDTWTELYQTLQAHFTNEEIDLLWKHIHFDEDNEHLMQLDVIGPILNKIQQQYLQRMNSSAHFPTEYKFMIQRLVVSLKGIPTIEKIFQALSDNDETLTREKVEQDIAKAVLEVYVHE